MIWILTIVIILFLIFLSKITAEVTQPLPKTEHHTKKL